MTEPPVLFEDALDLLDAFDEAGVEYLLIGAHAMAMYGVARATGDLDVLVRPSPANAARIVAALSEFGAPLQAHGIGVSDFAVEDLVYQLGLPPRRIDLLTSISGVAFEDAWASRVMASIDRRDVPVIGKSALIRNKRATGRVKDLLDVELLERSEGQSGS